MITTRFINNKSWSDVCEFGYEFKPTETPKYKGTLYGMWEEVVGTFTTNDTNDIKAMFEQYYNED